MKIFSLKTDGRMKLEWIFLFFIIPFFRPIGLELEILPSAYTFFVLWLYLALVIISIVFLVRRPILRSTDIGVKLYLCYIFGGTFFSELFFSTNSPKVSLISFCFAAFVLLYLSEWNYRSLINALHYYFVFLNIVNALFILLPVGKKIFMNDSIFFLGHRQSLPMLWIVSLFVMGLRLGRKERITDRKKIFLNIVYFCICTFNLFASGAAVSIIVGVICFIMFILLAIKEKFGSIKTSVFYWVFFVGLLINFLLVYGNIQYYFSDYIARWFGETVTLNGRTIIWEFFNREIPNSLIIGYGYNGLRVNVGWGASWVNLDYCHNSILQELCNGGIIGLVLYIFMVLSSLTKISLCKNMKNHKVTLCAFISFVVIMCSESVNYYNYFMLFLILVGNMWRLDESISEKGLVSA